MRTCSEVQSDPTFLGLPREVRDKILTLLLVVQDVTLKDRDSSEDKVTGGCVTEGDKATAAVLPTTTGAILISEVELKDFDKSWKRSSYVRCITETDDISEPEDDEDMDILGRSSLPTTYCLGSEVALQVLLVSRQIRYEASYIFYSKNRFYVNAMASLIPFLEDRPAAARQLIQKLSFPVPYGKQFLNADCDEEIPRCRIVTNETFAKACTYLADMPDYLSNLKQLDLRIWDFHDRWNGTPLTLSNLKLSSTRLKQLASVATPQIMAVSLLDWHPLAYDASYQVGYGDLEPVIFARLPEHICQKIQHCREGTIEEDEDEVSSLRTIIVSSPDSNYHRKRPATVRTKKECKPFSLVCAVLTRSLVTMKAMMPPTRISKRIVMGATKTGATTTRVNSRVVL